MHNISKSLAFRLFCLLLLVSAAVFFLLTTFIIRSNRQHLMQEIMASSERTDILFLLSMRRNMLDNRLDKVAQTIDALGNGPGIENIRIFSKKGNVVFSADSRQIRQKTNIGAKQCIVCHSGKKPLEHIPEAVRFLVFTSPDGHRSLEVLKSIRNEPTCAAPGCHPSPSKQKILGVLDSRFNLAEVDRNILASRNMMIIYSIGAILLIELFAGLFIMRMVHMRVVRLAEGSREVMKGNLDFSVQVEGNDEIADLARSFNSMVSSLKRAEAESGELSRKVVHIAKMASMGKLAASVAHEINNPLGGVLAYARLVSRKITDGPMTEEERKEALEYLEAAIGEIKRCGNIVRNLLHFSRSSESVMEKVDIHNVIGKSLLITNHHFEIHNIGTIAKLEAKDPNFFGNANQIEQVLIALFMNAVDAMPRGGTLTVETRDIAGGDALCVSVADNGRGIPPEIRPNIFEPFFTTKEDGASAGLGLSVVYGIMLRHGGEIEVESDPGRGTAFILTFPRQVKPQGEKEPVFDRPEVWGL